LLPQTGLQRTETHSGCEFCARRRGARNRNEARARNGSAIRGVVSHCEWVERILRGHADTGCADAGRVATCRISIYRAAGVRPDVRLTEGRGRQTAYPELTEIQEIGEHGQVLVTDISIERTIQVLAISRRHVRGQIREIEQR